MRAEFAVAGAGPAGCALAARLARAGRDVILVEQHEATRPVVGESLLPMGNRVLERLGISMEGFQRKDGAVFVRGDRAVRFPFAEAARVRWDHAHQVPREDFDARLRDCARRAGARFVHARVTGFDLPGALLTDRGPIRADRVIDATGRRKLLARATVGIAPHRRLRNAAVACRYRGVRLLPPARPGDITITAFDGGWFWFIPYADGTTSVGLVVQQGAGLGRPLWEAALDRCPEAAERLQGAERLLGPEGLQDFTSYANRFYGRGWALVGDAALFLDPVFSSGVLLALESADRLADVLVEGGDLAEDYERPLRRAASLFEKAILAFYEGDFLEVGLVPAERQDPAIRAGIISLLAGDVFDPAFAPPRRVARRLGALAALVRRGELGP